MLVRVLTKRQNREIHSVEIKPVLAGKLKSGNVSSKNSALITNKKNTEL